MYTLENKYLKVSVAAAGAELRSFYAKAHAREYIWQRDAAFWGKSSPLLFPIVGALKDDQYTYAGHRYTLGKHGFARDKNFSCVAHTAEELIFSLAADIETQACYPFDFELLVRYKLQGAALSCSYVVRNKGNSEMLFSIGAHPAIQLDFSAGQRISDYHIFFEKDSILKRSFLKDNLLGSETEVYALEQGRLPLHAEMFVRDAWLMENLQSEQLSLRDRHGSYGLSLAFTGFPYFGLWSVPGSSFICLEPWAGVNDSPAHSGLLAEKRGILHLPAGETWTATWNLALEEKS